MKHFAQSVLCLVAALMSLPAFGQVATVYITNEEATFIYEASSSGNLTLTHGYVAEGDLWITGTKSYIFGASPNGHSNLDSFKVNPNGSLSLVASRNVLQDTQTDDVLSLFLDRTGATLYASVAVYSPSTFYFASYSIDKKNGELTYLGKVQSETNATALSFTGDNKYAYAGLFTNGPPAVLGFERKSNGLLVLGKEGAVPKAKPGLQFSVSGGLADPTDHVAFVVYPFNDTGKLDGLPQLGTYTVSSTGNLSTKSTYENMPAPEVGGLTGFGMSPSGKLLAVGGYAGLRIYHFNGSDPITKFTGSLGTGFFYDFAWDNDNHMYTFNQNTERVHVFSATPSEVKEVPGSPFTIPDGAMSLLVIPK
jgi:hypothetical protein